LILAGLPLALAQAAAVIIDQGITCAQYWVWFADRARALEELFPTDADADGYARTVATTWELSAAAADRIDPVGLARPMAALVSMLDPAGALEAALTCQAACARLSEVTQTQITPACNGAEGTAGFELAITRRSRHQSGQSPCDTDAQPDGRAILQTLTTVMAAASGRCVADGLLEIWPEVENDQLSSESLRSNTAALAGSARAGLWDSRGTGGHALLFRAGHSLLEAGLVGPAIQYHQHLWLPLNPNY
jgi:hypothetical protein